MLIIFTINIQSLSCWRLKLFFKIIRILEALSSLLSEFHSRAPWQDIDFFMRSSLGFGSPKQLVFIKL